MQNKASASVQTPDIILPVSETVQLPTRSNRAFAMRLRDGVIAVCGWFMFLSFFVYLIKMMVFPEGLLPLAAAILICTVLFIWFLCRRILHGKIWEGIRWAFAAGLALYTLSFFVLFGTVLYERNYRSAGEDMTASGIVIVFGAKINGTQPGRPLRERLDRAIHVLEKNPDSLCVLSGGQGADEDAIEAQVMADYLVQKGVDQSRLLLETKAESTQENIKYTLQLLEKKELLSRPLGCVSSEFHIPRIRLMLRKQGYDAQFFASPSTDFFSLYTSLVREYLSWGKFLLFGT